MAELQGSSMKLEEASLSASPWKYQVYLSFSGEDTRRNFTSHLHAALYRQGIITFVDDHGPEKGKPPQQALLQAIKESLISIVILSPYYAFSTWCLNELDKIIEAKEVLGRVVFPVFYGVDPSEVRRQEGIVGEALKNHEERFDEDKAKVERWRIALTKVANLSGFDTNYYRLDAELIERIVSEIVRVLSLNIYRGLVGIDSKIAEMEVLLQKGLDDDIRFVGIWGMGGIGKTTIARVVFEKIHSQFEISCFLADVREVSQVHGLIHLQKKLLSSRKIRGIEIEALDHGKHIIRTLLCRTKVLLVLDDVSSIGQLEALAGNENWFGPGSRIIVTTRDKHLLDLHGISAVYEVNVLNEDNSLQLFNLTAFKGDKPPNGYLELSKSVINYARGNPLALKVIGSFLYGRDIDIWEDALNKLKRDPLEDIYNVLKISYDQLDHMEKEIFLDIACFFNGLEKDYVIQIFNKCGVYAMIGIQVLIDKSLVICDDAGHLWMHDLLQAMGRSIVIQESPKDATRRSRLWSVEDVDRVFRENMGSQFIQAIGLELSKPHEAHWDPEIFSRMLNLRLFIVSSGLHLPRGLKCLSERLKILIWSNCPLKALPLGVPLDELIYLKMSNSKIEQLWPGTQKFQKLEFIDLSHSKDLIQTPIVSGVPNLEALVLEGCRNLVKVDESVGRHKKLALLNLKDCINLKTLPRKLEMNSLKVFILSGCSKLERLTEFGENMECVSLLDLNGCKNLVDLPNSIHNLRSLRFLNVSGSKLSSLPDNTNNFVEVIKEDATTLDPAKGRNYYEFIFRIYLDKPISNATLSKSPAGEPSSPASSWEMVGHLEGSRFKYSEALKSEPREFRDEVQELTGVQGNITDNDDLNPHIIDDGDLNPLVSHCFLFPLSYQFTREELVTLWIAEGLLQSDHIDGDENVADTKFDSLVSREIIVPFKSDQLQNCVYHEVEKLLYKVNESKVPSFEDSLPVDGYLRVMNEDLNKISRPEKVLHLSLLCEIIDEMTLKSMKRFKHLHTLFLIPNCGLSIQRVPHHLFLILNNLRSLNLSGSLVSELPSSIGHLKSLQYIDLSRTPIRKLPNSIEYLQNLQTLKLWDCLNLVELPKGLGKLTNLRHLGIDVVRQLKCMPPAMGNLTKLQTLSAFIVGRNDGCQIGELKNTINLRGAFCISRLENVLDFEEAKTADLINKKFISKLELWWTNIREYNVAEEEKILEQLQPQLGLKELRISYYGGLKLPSWIDNPSYASLVDITLYNFKNCHHLPAFGRLPSLKVLHIKEMNELKGIDHQFYGNGQHDCVFPKLEELTVQGMHKLEEWKGIKNGDLPSLHKLKVENCPKLMSLPLLSCLCSLKYFEMSYCPNIRALPSEKMAASLEYLLIKDCPGLSKRCTGSKGQDWRKIAHVPNIIIDDEIYSNLHSTATPSDHFSRLHQFIPCLCLSEMDNN